MSPERRPINWDKMANVVKKFEGPAWSKILELSEADQDECIELHGYKIQAVGFKNYPPRLEFRANLNIPEDNNSNPTKVDNLLRKAAKESSSDEIKFSVRIRYHHPMMDSLDTDPVFGKDPKLPHGMSYSFNPNREQFIKE